MYPYADKGFASFDFDGKGYINVEDILRHPIIYKLPFTKQEIQEYFKNFVLRADQDKDKMNAVQFRNFFYTTSFINTIQKSKSVTRLSENDQKIN